MNNAIKGGRDFIVLHGISIETFDKHFKLDDLRSKAIYGPPYKERFFNKKIDFVPNAYHIRFLVTLENDTIYRSFFFLADSTGKIDSNSNYSYVIQDVLAVKKVLTNQYLFSYSDAKKFTQKLKRRRYNIMFLNSLSGTNYKHVWSINKIIRKRWTPVYVVDPITGKIQKRKSGQLVPL